MPDYAGQVGPLFTGQTFYANAGGLSQALTRAEVSGGCVIVTGTQTLTANTTVPSGVSLTISDYAIINNAGYNFSVYGPFHAGAYQVFSGSGTTIFNAISGARPIRPEWFGADPTGINDSTYALQNAINVAQRIYGSVELGAGATYSHNAPLTFGVNSIEFFGHGDGSVIKASAAMTGQIVATDTYYSKWHDFVVDGGSFNCDGIHLVTSNAPSDKTTTNSLSRVVSQNHPTAHWDFYNQGHEDLSILDCLGRSTGDGSSQGLYVSLPGGAMRVLGSSIFGGWNIKAQQFFASGCVTGPIYNNNLGYDTHKYTGCYMYDGSNASYPVISGNMANILEMDSCYLVCAYNARFYEAPLESVEVIFRGCEFIYTNATAQAIYIVRYAGNGTGKLTLEDCQLKIGAATSAAVQAVTSGTSTWVKISPYIQGASAPTTLLTAPAVPASGTQLLQSFAGPTLICVSGGTVSAIAIDSTNTGLTSGAFVVRSGQYITLTYTGTPSWTWFQAE